MQTTTLRNTTPKEETNRNTKHLRIAYLNLPKTHTHKQQWHPKHKDLQRSSTKAMQGVLQLSQFDMTGSRFITLPCSCQYAIITDWPEWGRADLANLYLLPFMTDAEFNERNRVKRIRSFCRTLHNMASGATLLLLSFLVCSYFIWFSSGGGVFWCVCVRKFTNTMHCCCRFYLQH